MTGKGDKSRDAELSQDIPADLFEQKFGKYLDTEMMRLKIISVIKDHTGMVEFSNLVKQYAAEEMDKRIFRSAQYWLTVVATALVTGLVSAGIALLIKR